MTRKIRTIIFYSFFALFLIVSGVVLVYAQGYRYSFSEASFLRTGAVQIKTNTEAQIFLDDKLMGSTSFLSNSLGIDRLLPGEYTLRAQKNGHTPWEKSITVEEGRVIAFSKVILFPSTEEKTVQLNKEIVRLFEDIENIDTEEVPLFVLDGTTLYWYAENAVSIFAQDVEGFTVHRDKSRVAWWTVSGELWVQWLGDANFQPFRKSGDRELIANLHTSISRALWYPDSEHIALETPLGIRVYEIDIRGGLNIIRL